MGNVFDIATSRDAEVFLTAATEDQVIVWDLRTRRELRSFPAWIDLGGQRLALSPDGSVGYVGAYSRYGVAAHNVVTGEVLWRRKDLKRVQTLLVSPDGARLYVELEGRSAVELDTATGDNLNRLPAVKGIWESPFAPLQLRVKRSLELTNLDGSRVRSYPRESFAALHAVFGPDRLLVSEAGEFVRCFDLVNYLELWRYGSQGSHALRLGFHEGSGSFSAVMSSYKDGGPPQLVRFGDSGPVGEPEILPGAWCHEYAKRGAKLVLVGDEVDVIDV